MRHQITFVGGQLLPVFLGIKEFSPDKIHFIVSKESRDRVALLKSFFNDKVDSENLCEPFDFISIKDTCEGILRNIGEGDEIQFNMTGGTKVMLLAAQALIQDNQLHGFYINPDNTILNLPSYTIQDITCEIKVEEFLELSGHKLNKFKTIEDFCLEDIAVASAIDDYAARSKTFPTVSQYFRKKYNEKGKSIPKSGIEILEENIEVVWSNHQIEITKSGSCLFSAKSNIIYNLFFFAGWWELQVANAISEWAKPRELLIQCELPFKGDLKTPKNEIDVLINLGKKLIFVECKSGIVKQEDINKMKIIRDTYGGVISKSILVSRFLPSRNIIEKCNELNIELFYQYKDKDLIHQLSEIIVVLENLEMKLYV